VHEPDVSDGDGFLEETGEQASSNHASKEDDEEAQDRERQRHQKHRPKAHPCWQVKGSQQQADHDGCEGHLGKGGHASLDGLKDPQERGHSTLDGARGREARPTGLERPGE
jgi:hypothetical protein